MAGDYKSNWDKEIWQLVQTEVNGKSLPLSGRQKKTRIRAKAAVSALGRTRPFRKQQFVSGQHSRSRDTKRCHQGASRHRHSLERYRRHGHGQETSVKGSGSRGRVVQDPCDCYQCCDKGKAHDKLEQFVQVSEPRLSPRCFCGWLHDSQDAKQKN